MRGAVLAANPVLQVGDRLLARFADAIVANSEYTAERVEKIYARRALVAPPGVDAERFGMATEKEPLVLAVGRLTRFKRFDLVLQAAALLKAQGVPASWVIAGGGEEEESLRRLAADLAVRDAVEFAGRVDERTLAGYFARASVVAVTSIGEPFGIVPVEAMVAGTAVVCSDSGGPSLTVQDGVTGLHFRSGDAADFAAKVARLLQHPELAREMGRRGRRLALEQFTWERTTAGIAAAIEQVLAAPSDRTDRCRTAT
jgi:glycosyltransferase involved in cell wall biosynthesis